MLMICVQSLSLMQQAVLNDGLISATFGNEKARKHFTDWLKRDMANVSVYYDGLSKCFSIQPNTLRYLGYKHGPILIDRHVSAPNMVVKQLLFQPQTAIDLSGDVDQPRLCNAVFVRSVSGRWGLPVEDATNGKISARMHGWEDPFVPEEVCKASTQIRIEVFYLCSQFCKS